tara:strand:+ start:71 stop:565 length:495 start_codon:yes stop_codon:yes gene_type:complete
MNQEFIADSSFWVAISFIIFLILVFRPLSRQLSNGLDKKINDLKRKLDESKNLKTEAEKIYKEQVEKQKENESLIKRIGDETKREIKKIEKQVSREIELNMMRKIKNFDQISTQMQNDLKDELKAQIMQNVLDYTEVRIRKNLSGKHNSQLIEKSLKNIPKNLL